MQDNLSPEEILELQKKNCIFCKIINKEIPSHEIYSDDKVSVILDINPANDGHCLILPKEHYQILPQIPKELIGYLFIIAKRTSRLLLKSLGVRGTTTFIANGALAGQKAPHFMIHVIPRKASDMLFELPKTRVDDKELSTINQKLVVRLSGKQVEFKPEKGPELKDVAVSSPKETVDNEPKETEAKETKSKDGEPKESKELSIDDISKLFTK